MFFSYNAGEQTNTQVYMYETIDKYVTTINSYTSFALSDDEFISCYGRKANTREWRTNISSGGSIILREANDKIIDIAKKATKALGLDIAGVDIMYDIEKEEYIVLEVNGIPAFATPKQEKLGLNFNDKKIEKIVNLIESKIKHKKRQIGI